MTVPSILRQLTLYGFLWALPFGLSAGEPVVLPAQTLYNQAVDAQSKESYGEALSLFLEVQNMAGDFKATHQHIAQCVELLRVQRDLQLRVSALEQVQKMLALRESAMDDLSRRTGNDVVTTENGYMLSASDTVFAQDEPAWEALAALISTIPGGWVTLEIGAGSDSPRGARGVAERLVREGIIPFERVSVWRGPRVGPGLDVFVSFNKRERGAQQKVDPGLLVRIATSPWILDEVPEQQFDIFILNPGAYRRWRLEISNEGGDLIQRWEGDPKVLFHVRWNGHVQEGKRVALGRYNARLVVDGWKDDPLAEETSFFVDRKALVPKPVPRPAPPAHPLHRQHRFFIRFQKREATPLDRDREIVSRAAYLMAINPNQRLVVTGGVDRSEPDPESMALRRTQTVIDSLMNLNVPRSRLVLGENVTRDGAGVALTFEGDSP